MTRVGGDCTSMKKRKSMLFNRNLTHLNGGHLKFFDYLNHSCELEHIKPILYLAPTSNFSLAQELIPSDVEIVDNPVNADIFFLAGKDWQTLDTAGIDTSGKPVVSLIQSLRQCFPGHPLHQYLSRPVMMRVCVSSQISAYLQSKYPRADQLITIPNGTDLHSSSTLKNQTKSNTVFIGGLKDKDLAERLASVLDHDHIPVDLCLTHIPRFEFLSRLASAKIAVLLPVEEEGFYLPALEAMVLGSVAIVPDCIGSRDFCIKDQTCLVPERTLDSLHNAVRLLWNDKKLRSRLKNAAFQKCAPYTIEKERRTFQQALRLRLERYYSA